MVIDFKLTSQKINVLRIFTCQENHENQRESQKSDRNRLATSNAHVQAVVRVDTDYYYYYYVSLVVVCIVHPGSDQTGVSFRM